MVEDARSDAFGRWLGTEEAWSRIGLQALLKVVRVAQLGRSTGGGPRSADNGLIRPVLLSIVC